MSAPTPKKAKTSGGQIAATEPEVFLLYEGGEVAEELRTKLTRVRVASQVTAIPKYSFRGCEKLVEVQLNEGLQMIGEGAFSDCTALRSVNIPSTITKWGYGAFHNCSNLAKVQLSEGLQIVWPGAFANCSALRSVTVPSTVIGLDNYAFDRCNNLAEVKLNEGLQLIGEGTFQYCAALRSATVPSTVTELGVRAFRGCSNLSEVIFLVGERLLNKTFLDRRLSGEEGILNRRKINEMIGRHAFYDCPLAAVKISISWALCERMARLLPECSVSVVERIRRLPRLEHIQDGRVFACFCCPPRGRT